MLVEEEGSTTSADNDDESDEARVRRPLRAATQSHGMVFGPRVGQKALSRQGEMPRENYSKQTLCADINGFRWLRPLCSVPVLLCSGWRREANKAFEKPTLNPND